MILNLSAWSFRLEYSIEKRLGEKPTANYANIIGLKNIVPTFTNNAIILTFNLFQGFIDCWNNMLKESKKGMEKDLRTWFHIRQAGVDKGFFFVGNPPEMVIPNNAEECIDVELCIKVTFIGGYADNTCILVE